MSRLFKFDALVIIFIHYFIIVILHIIFSSVLEKVRMTEVRFGSNVCQIPEAPT